MNKLHFVAEKDLMILTLPTRSVSKEIKDGLKEYIQEQTGIDNVLVMEVDFTYHGNSNTAIMNQENSPHIDNQEFILATEIHEKREKQGLSMDEMAKEYEEMSSRIREKMTRFGGFA